MRPPGRIAAALAIALAFAGAVAFAQAPAAVDVHILKLWTDSGELIPKAEIVAAQRIIVSDAPSESSVTARAGQRRLGVELSRESDGDLRLERQLGRMTRVSNARTLLLDLTDPFRWGRHPRHGTHVRAAILCEPATTAKPFVALDVAGFMQRLVPILLEKQALDVTGRIEAITNLPITTMRRVGPIEIEWDSMRWKAGLVLGSVPLDLYLEDEQIERILEAASKMPLNLDDQSWPFLRTLIVLADRRALETLAKRTDDRPWERFGTGIVLTPRIPRSVEDSVLVAYAMESDPRMRGLAGWVATGSGSPDVFDLLAEDVRSGRAILPGTEDIQKVLADHIVAVRAWQSVTAPLLTLLASAVGIGVIMILMRLAVRRLF